MDLLGGLFTAVWRLVAALSALVRLASAVGR